MSVFSNSSSRPPSSTNLDREPYQVLRSHLDHNTWKWLLGLGACGGALAFLSVRYRICSPNEVLVRTGLGIPTTAISRNAIIWPFQQARKVSLMPRTYHFDLQSMSKEKVEFKLPVFLTIAPYLPEKNKPLFEEYVTLVENLEEEQLKETVCGVVEGEARILTANMTIEELFMDREAFKRTVTDKIRCELDVIGMQVLNMNIREMADFDEANQYFSYRKQRAIQTANYSAQADVSEARMKGESEVAERDAEARVNKALAESKARLAENKRAIEMAASDAQLAEAQAQARRKKEVADIEARMAARARELEMQQHVEELRTSQQLQALRADTLTLASVEAEAMRTRADAQLYAEQQKAKGIEAVYEAQARGLGHVFGACGSDPQMTKFFFALQSNLYPILAEKNAEAIKGLQPKVSIWNTGAGAGNDDAMLPIVKMLQSFTPLLGELDRHTGITQSIKQQLASSGLDNSATEATKNPNPSLPPKS